MSKKITMKYPKYVKDFVCIGGACEDTCCVGWDVDIDKITFRQYHRTKNPEMKKMFQKNVHNNENFTSPDVDYGKVKLAEGKRCPFLDCNNLCVIYTNLGEEFLSNVCTSFPRITNRIDGSYELSLDTACPEAARMILLNKEGIQFEESQESLGKHILSSDIDTRSKDFDQLHIKYLKEIRDFSINIIKNREYSISKRMFLLGTFMDELEEELHYNFDRIPSFIENYDLTEALESYDDIFPNPQIQVSYLNKIMKDLKVFKDVDSESFKEYTRELIAGLNLDDSDDINKFTAAYLKGLDSHFKEFMNEHSYIFENYLVNFMYKNLFPFSETDSVFDGYIMLLIRFSLMRFYLVGIAQHQDELTVENTVRFIQVFSKTIEHHKTYLVRVLKNLKKNEFDNMSFAGTLV